MGVIVFVAEDSADGDDIRLNRVGRGRVTAQSSFAWIEWVLACFAESWDSPRRSAA